MLLPLLEERTELVCGGTPVGVLVEGISQRLGLLHNGGALLDGLGDSGLACLGQRGFLGCAFLLQRLELGLESGQITHHCRLFGFRGQRLDGLVDFAGLHIVGLELVREQVQLGLQIKVTAGIQSQRLFLGGIRELTDLTFSFAVLDEHSTIVGDTAECFGGLHIGIGEAGGCGSRSGVLWSFLAKAAGLGAWGFIEAGLGTAGLLALTAGVVACSVVSLVFSDAVTFSSAMASSFK